MECNVPMVIGRTLCHLYVSTDIYIACYTTTRNDIKVSNNVPETAV